MRKVNLMMALLITGYILGVWNFLIVPKYYIVFGLKGFLVSLLPAGIAVFLACTEANSTKATRYLIYELLYKVARTPGVVFTLLMFLLIVLGVTAYASGWGLAYFLGYESVHIVPLAILTVLLAALLLLLAKGRTLEFIAGLSVLMVLFTLFSALVIRKEALAALSSEQARYYMEEVVASITSFSGTLTLEGTVMLLVSMLLVFGLGAGVYYVLGSFAPEDLDFRKVLLGVFFLQIVLSLATAYTIAYSLGPAFQAFEESVHNPSISPEESFRLYSQFQAIEAYATDPNVPVYESIRVFYIIPEIVKGTGIAHLLVLSFYFAGLTTIIVLLEMGAQMLAETVQADRRKALAGVAVVGMAVSAVMAMDYARTMFFAVPFAAVALVAAAEAYPMLRAGMPSRRAGVMVSITFLVLVGLLTAYYFLQGEDAVRLSVLLALVLLTPLAFNRFLLGAR